ncbi:hypothetical protein B0H10DRAFT_1944402 [Mycena sp. CBHHK59/15]|nr:hypothetical protein B0H10DRAFT_1944402 [Mycena sp. CBHHK59/15]
MCCTVYLTALLLTGSSCARAQIICRGRRLGQRGTRISAGNIARAYRDGALPQISTTSSTRSLNPPAPRRSGVVPDRQIFLLNVRSSITGIPSRLRVSRLASPDWSPASPAFEDVVAQPEVLSPPSCPTTAKSPDPCPSSAPAQCMPDNNPAVSKHVLFVASRPTTPENLAALLKTAMMSPAVALPEEQIQWFPESLQPVLVVEEHARQSMDVAPAAQKEPVHSEDQKATDSVSQVTQTALEPAQIEMRAQSVKAALVPFQPPSPSSSSSCYMTIPAPYVPMPPRISLTLRSLAHFPRITRVPSPIVESTSATGRRRLPVGAQGQTDIDVAGEEAELNDARDGVRPPFVEGELSVMLKDEPEGREEGVRPPFMDESDGHWQEDAGILDRGKQREVVTRPPFAKVENTPPRVRVLVAALVSPPQESPSPPRYIPSYNCENATRAAISQDVARRAQHDFLSFSAGLGGRFASMGWAEMGDSDFQVRAAGPKKKGKGKGKKKTKNGDRWRSGEIEDCVAKLAVK